MNNNNSKTTGRLLLTVIIVLSVILSVFLGYRRNIYHIDEVLSFSLANSTEGKYWFDWGSNGDIVQDPLPDESTFFDHWQDGSVFRNYVDVSKDERFRYDIPYRYQATDVSPPLYYALIHTISSIFPESFSLWMGIIPNIIFFVLSILFFYAIANKFFTNKLISAAVTSFWAFSRAGLSDMLYVRMYMLSTLLVLISFYLHLKLAEKKSRMSFHLLPLLFIVNAAGFLTQNYVYIFTFFMAVILCIIFIYRKEIKNMLIFGFTELGSLCAALLIFPAAYAQMTSSGYAQISQNHIFDGVMLKSDKFLVLMFNNILGISGDILGPVLKALVFILFMAAVTAILLRLLAKLNKKQKITFDDSMKNLMDKLESSVLKKRLTGLFKYIKSRTDHNTIILFVGCLFTTYIIDATSPPMPSFQARYFFMFFPLCFLAFAWLNINVIEYFSQECGWKKFNGKVFAVLLTVIAVTGNFLSRNTFMFYNKDQIDIAELTKGQVCYVLNDYELPPYMVHNHAAWLRESDRALFSYKWSSELIDSISNDVPCYFMLSENAYLKEDNLAKISENRNVEYVGNYYYYFLVERCYNVYRIS